MPKEILNFVNKMANSRSVIFQIFHRPSAISCRCLCTSSKRRLSRADPLIDKILRVDHAGEVGANRIYEGQMAVLGSSKSAPVIKVYFKQISLGGFSFV